MKRKILSVILVLAFCAGVFVPVQAADSVTPYTLGTTVSGTRALNTDVWYSMQIESDGLYKISHRTTTDSNYVSGGGIVRVYDKTGSIDLTALGTSDINNHMDAGYAIIAYNFNNLENAFIEEYAIYLHKGAYLLREYSGRGTNQFSFKVDSEKIATPYGEDKEPNNTAAEAIPLAINGKASGVMGGMFENGSNGSKSKDDFKDISDFYKIEIPSPMKCVFHLISDTTAIDFDILNNKGEVLSIYTWEGEVLYPWSSERKSNYNDLLKKYELNLEANFEAAGTYYIRLNTATYTAGYGVLYNPYLLTMGDGGGKPADPNPYPNDEIFEVDIPSEPGGKLTALVTEVGIKFDITPNASEFGYRIYRSTDPAIEGISISDFPLTKGQFVDVNIDPNTIYYYTIRKVIAEASFDRATIEIIPEVLGEPSKKIVLDSGGIIPPPPPPPGYDYTKNFLLMKIGEPNMLFNEETVEIDAG
ncbi:MAG: hypothetical protein FWH48_09595, partial [Oscillospiraceae bacterium]|nr:hypothetical protein [Oscillospiraceae bacterium]